MNLRARTSVLITVAAIAACSASDKSSNVGGDQPGAGVPSSGEITPGTTPEGAPSDPDADAGFVALASPVNVIITADNAYGFGYGSSAAMANYFGGVENPASQQIFSCETGPEKYTVPAADANVGSYLYIVSYADTSTTQGVIAQFFRKGGPPVYTGSGQWEVCATGVDFDLGAGGPKLAQINEQLVRCNGGDTDLATTSGGWRRSTDSPGGKLAIGEDNATPRGSPAPGNEFQVACGIDAAARWMWYDWEAGRQSGSPFIYPREENAARNPMKDFMIFRLAAQLVLPSSRVN